MARKPYNWQHLVTDYFTFSKGQRRAVIVLCIAITVVVFIPVLYQFFFKTITEKADPVTVQQVPGLKGRIDSFSANNQSHEPGDNSDYVVYREPANASHYTETSGKLFVFDPNTASINDWQRLGIREKTINTIRNYLAKGGHFNKAEDLKKIYGLKENDINRLMPYVQINIQEKQQIEKKENYSKPDDNNHLKSAVTIKPLDINIADTTGFKTLPGIGSKLAARIVNFRDKLGGFYAIEQVGETYGIPDSTFQKIKPLLFIKQLSIRKINLNTATAEGLRTPYIPYNVANAIVQFRTHNGDYKAVEDLRRIPLIDLALYVKIAPYLSVE